MNPSRINCGSILEGVNLLNDKISIKRENNLKSKI
nr:MAG TPA: hypothetical protein [Caudoviricetes sp.]